MSFPYKTVLLIGATSGIGLALAEKIIENGSHVIAVGRRQENLDKLKGNRENVSTIKFDITDLQRIPFFAETVAKAHPGLDCVVLNSGIQRSLDFSKPEAIDLAVVDEELTTNYTSYVHLTKYFLPLLQKQSGPTSLIFTTSGLALVPAVRCGNYCASKAALHHLILTMREQIKDAMPNVKVIEILPPAVQTELHDEKHQPDMKNGAKIGMPLDEFTDAAWKGLVEGKEQIPVGMAEKAYESFEIKRQEVFQGMVKAMAGKN